MTDEDFGLPLGEDFGLRPGMPLSDAQYRKLNQIRGAACALESDDWDADERVWTLIDECGDRAVEGAFWDVYHGFKEATFFYTAWLKAHTQE